METVKVFLCLYAILITGAIVFWIRKSILDRKKRKEIMEELRYRNLDVVKDSLNKIYFVEKGFFWLNLKGHWITLNVSNDILIVIFDKLTRNEFYNKDFYDNIGNKLKNDNELWFSNSYSTFRYTSLSFNSLIKEIQNKKFTISYECKKFQKNATVNTRKRKLNNVLKKLNNIEDGENN